jgi:DNA-binding response OmpR family regulator
MRILLVEDDPMIGKSLREALQDAGMSVDWARSGEDGEVALSVGAYAVVLLDIGLPGKSGIEVLRAARKTGNKTPLMLITARDELDDRVAGLDLGADDYITKPFEMRELMARLRAIMRRSGGAAISTLSNGEIELDLDTHEVRYRGKSLVLSAREFGLLRALLDRPGTIMSRAQLEEKLYGWGEEVESNAIDVLIHYLRRRFDKDIIRNVRGAGWLVPKSPQ